MKQKTSIEFTKAEIEIMYNTLMQKMKETFKSIDDFKHFRSIEDESPDGLFKVLENWYLLLKKIKKAKDQYEQKTGKKENKKSM